MQNMLADCIGPRYEHFALSKRGLTYFERKTMTTTSKRKTYLSICAYASTAVLLTACGGGGGSSNPLLSGAVIDGYIEGATVCLDVNNNGACDASEPSSTTSANGAYRLDTTGISTSGLTVIAIIPDTAKDSDDDGLTLVAAGKSAYTMATSADKPTVITPLTTLVVGKVKTDNITVAQATAKVLDQLGLPQDTNLHEDHVAKGNALVHASARQVAGELQQLQKSLPGTLSANERWTRLQQARDTVEKDAGTISTAPIALNMPSSLGAVATGQRFSYKMTSAKGKPINASAMLFVPKTTAPSGGWPLVVFGHGTTGVAAQCAPSVTMHATSSWEYAPFVALLVGQGVAVVAPDYEGLGSPDLGVVAGHPYLDLRSAGQSMALAAVAAKKILPTQLSGAWATLGHSQGGHAALAGAQFSGLANQQNSSLTYKGAVAVAPASNLLESLNTMWASVTGANTAQSIYAAYETLGISNMYTAYLVKGSQSTAHPIAPATVLGTNMLGLYNTHVDSTCLDEFSTQIADNVTQYAATNGLPANYPGVINSAVNTTKISSILAANEPGQSKLPGKTLIVQGGADPTVLPAITQKLVTQMKAKGSDVSLSLHEGADHSGVMGVPAALAAVTQHLQALFGAAAASN